MGHHADFEKVRIVYDLWNKKYSGIEISRKTGIKYATVNNYISKFATGLRYYDSNNIVLSDEEKKVIKKVNNAKNPSFVSQMWKCPICDKNISSIIFSAEWSYKVLTPNGRIKVCSYKCQRFVEEAQRKQKILKKGGMWL